MVVFGRPTRDPIPAPLGRYCPHKSWDITAEHREKAMAKRHAREREKWSKHTRELKDLEIGDHVYLQNLSGNNPLRWERTGIVVEAKPFQQYCIKIDGSGRVTLRNRKNLRKFTPFHQEKVFIPVSAPSATAQKSLTPITARNESPSKVPAASNGDLPIGEPSNAEDRLSTEHLPDTMEATPFPQASPVEPINFKPKKVPLALRRLLPHNNAGLQEL